MRYTGKITCAAVVFMAFIYWSLVLRDIDGRHVLFTFVFGMIGYVLGERYDRNMHNAYLDQLTHTYNRKFVYTLFPKLLAGVKRRKTQLAVFLVDVNNLKYINDTFGHQTGDEVITFTAATLLKQVRSSDIVARWGGDEFLIVAPKMDREQANALKERLKASIQGSINDGTKYEASIGFAVYPEDARTLEELINRADHQMYIVKASARQMKSIEVV